jgi:hypothetical protein
MAVFLLAFRSCPAKRTMHASSRKRLWLAGDEFTALQNKSGVTKEERSLQETPMGALLLVCFESADIEQSFAQLASRWTFNSRKRSTSIDRYGEVGWRREPAEHLFNGFGNGKDRSVFEVVPDDLDADWETVWREADR